MISFGRQYVVNEDYVSFAFFINRIDAMLRKNECTKCRIIHLKCV